MEVQEDPLDEAKRISQELTRPTAKSIDENELFQFFIISKDVGNCNYYNQDKGSCIMVTDLKNSTNLWAQNQEEMKK